MRLLDAFSPWVLPEVPGCPDPVLEHHIRAAAQQWCRDTSAWLALDDGQRTTAGQRDYEVESPAPESIVLQVRDAWLDDERLTPRQLDDGAARGYTQPAPGAELRLTFDPPPGGLLRLRLALAPSHTARSMPDEVALANVPAIAHAAKASLMLIPGQAWSNPQLAAYHAQEAARLATDARLRAIKDGVDGALVVRRRRFF